MATRIAFDPNFYNQYSACLVPQDEFAEHTRLDMPAHGGASTSNQMISIQPITDDEPVAKKPKLMMSNSPVSSSNIPLDDWESVNI
uniref:Uncharacterized protein n=1 Tax=Acrobeloides nanus TaxID=290746 RepID=A0A914D4G9_9BILA